MKPDILAAKYVELLERDLKLERARLELARKDLDFYRAKCERLELAVMNSQSAGIGPEYVRRTEPRRPGMHEVRLRGSMRPIFSELRKKWDALSAEEQETAMKEGWNLEEEAPKAQGG